MGKTKYEFLSKLVPLMSREEQKAMIKAARKVGGDPTELVIQISRGIMLQNRCHLSIQASYGHYCSPRLTLPYKCYESFEVAICDDVNDVYLSGSDLFGKDDELAVEIDKYANSSKIFGYLPTELVEKLYQRCKEKYGLVET